MTDLAIDPNSGAPAVAPEPPPDVESVPCVYCRKPIPAESFASWSTAKVLISAPCPECHRRVTLTEAGIQHEFISTWWPLADEDGAAFAHPAVDVHVDATGMRIAARASADDVGAGAPDDAMTPEAAGLACLVDFGHELGCWPRR